MILTFLEITHVRNLLSLQFHPHPETNFILGPNGSGKSSLLEGISLLSRGRSFRTPHIKKLISSGRQDVTAFGEISSVNSDSHRIGIRRTLTADTLVKIDGQKCDRLSDLAVLFPTMEIEANSFELVDGGPMVRRDILDWGLFHVEHRFLETWKRYRTALDQKSALLRSGNITNTKESIGYWNQLLADSGAVLDNLRANYVEKLKDCLSSVCSEYLELNDIGIEYSPGWNKEHYPDLALCLLDCRDSEIERQRCLYGPHRADLQLQWQGVLARDRCSRGQKKLVLYAVRLAQVLLFHRLKGTAPVLLLDDLPAELDKQNLTKIAKFLTDYPCQSFITAIDKDVQESGLMDLFGNHRVFHVEHGQLIHTS